MTSESAAGRPMVVVIMGITGAGKTTIGTLLAEVLAWDFYDADDFHPESNVALMRAGKPLDDTHRDPWLAALEALIRAAFERGESFVLACSALKSTYRERLRRPAASGQGAVEFVFLDLGPEEARRRVANRTGHYMPPTLVDSQLQTLEPPHHALRIDATLTPADIVHEIRAAFRI